MATMRRGVAVVIAWILSNAPSWGQNCVISGGANLGTITQNCNQTTAPPRETDGLYQGATKIGQVSGRAVVDEQRSSVAFERIAFNAYPDPGKPFEYGKYLLRCNKFPHLAAGQLPPPIFMDLEISVACQIIDAN